MPKRDGRDVLQNGAAIRCFRTRSGLSQSTLARMAGTAQNGLSEIEAEQRSGRLETLVRIANVLDVPVQAILRHRVHAEALAAVMDEERDAAVAS